MKDELSPIGSIEDNQARRIGMAPGRNEWHGKEPGSSSFLIIDPSYDAPFVYLFLAFSLNSRHRGEKQHRCTEAYVQGPHEGVDGRPSERADSSLTGVCM